MSSFDVSLQQLNDLLTDDSGFYSWPTKHFHEVYTRIYVGNAQEVPSGTKVPVVHSGSLSLYSVFVRMRKRKKRKLSLYKVPVVLCKSTQPTGIRYPQSYFLGKD
ncbi:hypothetical protein PAMP_009796 [Pampus punctatissimus]